MDEDDSERSVALRVQLLKVASYGIEIRLLEDPYGFA
jgi:hypothetical protein